jgi:riboflavin kinase/FMN adenylyltransferase
MEVLNGMRALERKLQRPVVLTIGNFDGVHSGHRRIIESVVRSAKDSGGTSVVYTFRPHPQIALRPEKNLELLTTYDERRHLIGVIGPDLLIEEPFSRDFSNVPADVFFSEWLIGKLDVTSICVGHDFGFGRQREAGIERLKSICASRGVDLSIVPPIQIDGMTVSSSKIRECLKSRDFDGAAHLLGYAFSYSGIVVKGDGRGRQIGFPTANIQFDDKIFVPNGVYATWAWAGDRRIASVTNLGIRPTFNSEVTPKPRVESHLLDESGDWYGRRLRLEFAQFIRPEQKFDSIESLKAKIRQDVDAARKILATAP